MLIIGLTGSLATGKSTVAKILSGPPYSLPIIDADVLARDAVQPGTRAYAAIVADFGPTTPDLLLPVPDPDPAAVGRGSGSGSSFGLGAASWGAQRGRGDEKRPLNRAALGRRVFGRTASRTRARAALGAIVHPAVRRLMLAAVVRYYVRGHWAVVMDIPLLFESGLDVFCGAVLMVAVADPAEQMRRLRLRDPGLSAREADERVASQMALSEKIARCEARGDATAHVVWNVTTKDDLRAKVDAALQRLESSSKPWRLWLWMSPFAAVAFAAWVVWKAWTARTRWEAKESARGKDTAGGKETAGGKIEKRE